MNGNFLNSLQRPDAWDDPDLNAYFTKNAAIRELEGFVSRRCLAVGLKGIGKTAAFRYLAEFDRSPDVVVGINRRDYRFFLDGTAVHWANAQALFEDDLVMEALRALIASSLGRKISAQRLRAAKQLFGTYKDALGRVIKSIGGVNILGVGFTRLRPQNQPPAGLQLEAETRKAQELLREICIQGVKVRIVIDDPETIFHSGPELNPHLLGGLFLAALRLSGTIPNFKVIILIKTHIYYPVVTRMEELDKFPGAMLHLGWKREELLQVLERRLQWAHGAWPDYVDGDDNTAKELIRTAIGGRLRTGPRELLRWSELAIRGSPSGKISLESIEASRAELAQYSLRALEAAFSDQYPGLGEVIRRLFHDFPSREFTPRDLEDHILQVMTQDDEMMHLRSHQWLRRLTNRTLPKTLLESGALSFKLDKELVLPYEDRYDEDHFRAAGAVRLTPILADAL